MSPAPWTAGDRLDDLTLLGPLGAGGMGSVFLAEQAGSGARFAVKALDPGASEDEEERFRREGQAQAAVDRHPNVVRVHRAGRHAGRLYLVLDLATGGDLAARLRAGPLEPRAAAELVRDLARGLEHVHRRGVLHRDLKPANVLFDERDTPQLVDFGLARLEGVEALTQTGAVLGTPAYMSPEQAAGEHERVGAQSDVYGLGAVLYHALTGQPPFAGATVLNVLHAVLSEAPVPPRALRPEVPRALSDLCLRALAKDPAQRPESAAALAQLLDAAGEASARAGWARPAAGLALVLALALGAGSLAALRARPPVPVPVPGPAASSPPEASAEVAPLDSEAAARPGLEALNRLEDLVARNTGALAWLAAHRGTSRTAEVEALLAATRDGAQAIWKVRTQGMVWLWGRGRALHWIEGRLEVVTEDSRRSPCGEVSTISPAAAPAMCLVPAAGELLVGQPRAGVIEQWLLGAGSARRAGSWSLSLERIQKVWAREGRAAAFGPCACGKAPKQPDLVLRLGRGGWGPRLHLDRPPVVVAFDPAGAQLVVGGGLPEENAPEELGWLQRFALPDLRPLGERRRLRTRADALCFVPGALLVGTQGGIVRSFGLNADDPDGADLDFRPPSSGLRRPFPVRGLACSADGVLYVAQGLKQLEGRLTAVALRPGLATRWTRRIPSSLGVWLSADERRLLVRTGEGYELWPALR
ncbi:MAG: serine/threonine-protein kinase [Planctomycetota bacterium]